MKQGRISTPAIMLVAIRKISSTLISLWNSSGEKAHGRIPPIITAKVLKTEAPVLRSAVMIASSSRRAAHHFVADTRDGVDAVVDAEADTERDDRNRVDGQSDIARVHVDEGAEVGHHARDDEERARHGGSKRKRAAEEDHQQHEREIDEVEPVEHVVGRE